MSIITPTYLRGKMEDQIKAPLKELYLQYDPALGKTVWAFKYENKQGKSTVYRARDDSEEERLGMAEILKTGKIPGRGNIFHPDNRSLGMPVWIARGWKWIGGGAKQSD